jgi:hypothetical protein
MATFCGLASAEEPVTEAPAKPAEPALNSHPPDVVELKNGGMLRGTISESVPGQYVTIVLITGETRKIPDSEVRRAGRDVAPTSLTAPAVSASNNASSEAPKRVADERKPQPFAVIHAAEARVNVVSVPQGNTLFVRSAAGAVLGFDELCTAPCDVSLPAGTHTFGVAEPGGKPRKTEPLTLPAGSSTVLARYTSRTELRVAVGLGGGVATVGGFAWLATGLDGHGSGDSIAVGVGSVIAVLGVLALSTFALIPDSAHVSILPGPQSAPTSSTRRDVLVAERPASDQQLRDALSGLTLNARF